MLVIGMIRDSQGTRKTICFVQKIWLHSENRTGDDGYMICEYFADIEHYTPSGYSETRKVRLLPYQRLLFCSVGKCVGSYTLDHSTQGFAVIFNPASSAPGSLSLFSRPWHYHANMIDQVVVYGVVGFGCIISMLVFGSFREYIVVFATNILLSGLAPCCFSTCGYPGQGGWGGSPYPVFIVSPSFWLLQASNKVFGSLHWSHHQIRNTLKRQAITLAAKLDKRVV
jgi:hypothetical protein